VIALRVGATAESAVHQLRYVADQAGNVTGASSGRAQIQGVEDYLRWTETAERMLANVLPPDLVSDLIHTRRYWALRATTGGEPRLTPLLLDEVTARKRELDDLAAEFEVERRRWLGDPVLLAVPDTNMFLQKDAPFESINWPGALECDTDVRIVLPIVVIHELDRLKRQGNNTTQKMARDALKWLSATLPMTPNGGPVKISEPAPAATVEVYVTDGVSRPADADGVIIAVSGWLQAVSGLPTKLVTRDLGMRLRASARGIEAVQLPDS
jgi:hypothetical protein